MTGLLRCARPDDSEGHVARVAYQLPPHTLTYSNTYLMLTRTAASNSLDAKSNESESHRTFAASAGSGREALVRSRAHEKAARLCCAHESHEERIFAKVLHNAAQRGSVFTWITGENDRSVPLGTLQPLAASASEAFHEQPGCDGVGEIVTWEAAPEQSVSP